MLYFVLLCIATTRFKCQNTFRFNMQRTLMKMANKALLLLLLITPLSLCHCVTVSPAGCHATVPTSQETSRDVRTSPWRPRLNRVKRQFQRIT